MVDYDGPDALKTYLNALAWTALTEPTYFFDYEQINNDIANTVIILMDALGSERLSETEYALYHRMNVFYTNSTKAALWPNLKYIITKLWTLASSNAFYSIGTDINVSYAENQKVFSIPVTYTEMIAM